MSADADPTDEYDAIQHARDTAAAHERKVALLELLASADVQVRDAHLEHDDTLDGSAVTVDAIVPEDHDLATRGAAPEPETFTDHLDVVSTRIDSLESSIDTLDDRLHDLEDELASEVSDVWEEVWDLQTAIEDLDATDTDLNDQDAPANETTTVESDGEDLASEPTEVDDDPTGDAEPDGLTHTVDEPVDTETTTPDDTAEKSVDELRADILATAVDDAPASISYLSKGDVRALVDTHVDHDVPEDATMDDLWSELEDQFEITVDPGSGGLLKADVQALYDEIHADTDGAVADEEAPGDDAGDDDPDASSAPTDDDSDEPESPADETPSVSPAGTKHELATECCLALGIEPPTDVDPDSNGTLRDLAAALSDYSRAQLVGSKKARHYGLIGDALEDDRDWQAHKDDWRALHDLVVPSERTDGPLEWNALEDVVEIPSWLDEASLHDVVDDNDRLQDVAHDLGWEADISQLRCILYLIGRYQDLDQPEASAGSKYSTTSGGEA